MKKFKYRNRYSMTDQTVKADHITFEPGHVVFWAKGRTKLILAESNEYVSNLREVTDE